MRKCPAEEVAMLETFLILSNLVKAFTMRCPPGDMMNIGTQYQAGTGFIRYPKPYKVVFQPRD